MIPRKFTLFFWMTNRFYMNNLFIRIVSGVFYAGIIISVLLSGFYPFSFLMIVVGVLGMYELYKISDIENKIQVSLGVITSIGIILSYNYHFFSLKMIIIPLYFLFLVELFNFQKFSFKNIGITLTGIVLIIIPITLSIEIINTNYEYLLKLFVLLWVNDSFAFIVGKKYGKIKLYKSISPNKTWEGFLSGLLMTLLVSFFLFSHLSLFFKISFSLIISIGGTLGDLVESMFKRKAGVKDSGNLIPAHGGILDRFDSFFFSVPFVYLLLNFL